MNSVGEEHRVRLGDLIAFSLFVLGMCLGIYGFWGQRGSEAGEPLVRALNALHSTLQLVVLNVDAENTKIWQLMVARIVLPLSFSLLLLSMLVERFDQWRLRLWLSLRPSWLRPLVLVLGCGESGLKLARYYRSGWMKVVGVDRELNSVNARRFRAQGFDTLAIDFSDQPDARSLPLRSAKRVVICTGDDHADLQIGRTLLGSAHARRDRRWLLATIEDGDLKRAVEFDPLFDGWQASLVDLIHTSARLMFRDEAPHILRPGRFVTSEDNPCHIVLVAGRRRRSTFLMQGVRALVYSTTRRLRVTVLTEDAPEFERDLRRLRPALFGEPAEALFGGFAPLADLQFVDSSVGQIDAKGLRLAHHRQPVDAVYVVGDNDAQTALMLSETIKAVNLLEPPPPVVAAFAGQVQLVGAQPEQATGGSSSSPRVQKSPDYAFPVNPDDGPAVRIFELDGWIQRRRPSDAQASPEDHDDGGAKAIYEVYPHANTHWDHLPEHERWWNRYSADHALLKLALIAPGGCVYDVTDADMNRHLPWLAELEHRRYAVERLLDGWLRRLPGGDDADNLSAQGRTKNNRYHLNPTLQPFNVLHTGERGKDEGVVKTLRKLHLALKPAGTRQVRKRPVTVAVRFTAASGTLSTLEGQVRYAPGDALLTGTAGECWPVERTHFDAWYEPAPGTQSGEDGAYCKRPMLAWARQLTRRETARVGRWQDTLQGLPSDWLVYRAPNECAIVNAAIFEATYEMIDPVEAGTGPRDSGVDLQ